MTMIHPLLEAINTTIEANQDNSHRNHMGASIIGDICARKIWLGFRWAVAVKHQARLLRLFNRGKLEEDRFVKWLEDAGVTVHQIDAATGKQYRFTGYKGHFGGEIDGVGVGILEGAYLLEYKTHNDKSFRDVQANGVALSKTQHYVQMQIYMGAMRLPRGAYFAINKNTDEIYVETIEFEPECYLNYTRRAEMIIDAPEPPPRISNQSSWFECKWCEHHAICHMKAAPLKNCRTCAHSTPIEKGQWHCEQDRTKAFPILPIELIKTGCDKYVVHPLP